MTDSREQGRESYPAKLGNEAAAKVVSVFAAVQPPVYSGEELSGGQDLRPLVVTHVQGNEHSHVPTRFISIPGMVIAIATDPPASEPVIFDIQA